MITIFTATAYARQILAPLPNQSQAFFPQVLDHFDYLGPQLTWPQRYFIIQQHFNPKEGAVLLYICGEYVCPGIPEARQWAVQIAKETRSLILVLQHRFYGQSIPSTLNVNDLRLLTKQQALADLAYFIGWVKQNNKFNVTNNPWVTIGGSYPGALSAWFRYKYPHLTVGAIASSAVVNMIQDFWQFDEQIYSSAFKSGKNCVDSIRDVTKFVETQLAKGGSANLLIKQDFGATFLTDAQFLFFLADIFVEQVQYGKRTDLCSMLFQDVNKSYAAIKEYAKSNHLSPADYGAYYLANVTYQIINNSTARAWTWQTCTEVGWFQTPSKSHSMRSSLLNLTFWVDWCNRIFGINSRPRVERGNIQLGAVSLDVKNLILTNGGEDPWRWAGIQKSTNQLQSFVLGCKNCAHCVDLYTPNSSDSNQLKRVRAHELKSIKGWIKEYWKQHRGKFVFEYD